jgi:hypothetical protein
MPLSWGELEGADLFDQPGNTVHSGHIEGQLSANCGRFAAWRQKAVSRESGAQDNDAQSVPLPT